MKFMQGEAEFSKILRFQATLAQNHGIHQSTLLRSFQKLTFNNYEQANLQLMIDEQKSRGLR